MAQRAQAAPHVRRAHQEAAEAVNAEGADAEEAQAPDEQPAPGDTAAAGGSPEAGEDAATVQPEAETAGTSGEDAEQSG